MSCPIVRDTRSVPCWLSDYDGDRYYLTIQSDVSAEVQPPMLGHQVLVEGVVSAAPQICGGIVLSAVRLSVMPERDANCNTQLPAEDRYTIDFNPRPPGPSGGRLAFDPDPRAAKPPRRHHRAHRSSSCISTSTARVVPASRRTGVASCEVARQVGAKSMRITGVRGAHRLSNGMLLRESPEIGQRRAGEVARLLAGAGLNVPATIRLGRMANPTPMASMTGDSRRVTVVLEP